MQRMQYGQIDRRVPPAATRFGQHRAAIARPLHPADQRVEVDGDRAATSAYVSVSVTYRSHERYEAVRRAHEGDRRRETRALPAVASSRRRRESPHCVVMSLLSPDEIRSELLEPPRQIPKAVDHLRAHHKSRRAARRDAISIST